MQHSEFTSLSEIARELDMPISTIRYYKENFLEFLPYTGYGKNRRYKKNECIQIFKLIKEMYNKDQTIDQIKEYLSTYYPRNVEVAYSDYEEQPDYNFNEQEQTDITNSPQFNQNELMEYIVDRVSKNLSKDLEVIENNITQNVSKEISKVEVKILKEMDNKYKEIITSQHELIEKQSQQIQDLKNKLESAEKVIGNIKNNISRFDPAERDKYIMTYMRELQEQTKNEIIQNRRRSLFRRILNAIGIGDKNFPKSHDIKENEPNYIQIENTSNNQDKTEK